MEVVYGVGNNGENEGIEVYYHKNLLNYGFLRSRRWLSNEIPKKYQSIFS